MDSKLAMIKLYEIFISYHLGFSYYGSYMQFY